MFRIRLHSTYRFLSIYVCSIFKIFEGAITQVYFPSSQIMKFYRPKLNSRLKQSTMGGKMCNLVNTCIKELKTSKKGSCCSRLGIDLSFILFFSPVKKAIMYPCDYEETRVKKAHEKTKQILYPLSID